MSVPMVIAKKRIAMVWLGGGGALLMIVFIQSLTPLYSGIMDEVWAWLLPKIIPSFTLIAGVYFSDVRGQSENDSDVDSFVFNLSFWISAVFLIVVALCLFVPTIRRTPNLPVLMQSKDLLLAGQGLVSASLGAFFVSKKLPVRG